MALWAVQSSLFLLYSTFLHVCSSFIRYFLYESHDIFMGRCFAGGENPRRYFFKQSPCHFFFPFLHFLQLCKQIKDQHGYYHISLCCKVVVFFFYINGRTPYYKLLCF